MRISNGDNYATAPGFCSIGTLPIESGLSSLVGSRITVSAFLEVWRGTLNSDLEIARPNRQIQRKRAQSSPHLITLNFLFLPNFTGKSDNFMFYG